MLPALGRSYLNILLIETLKQVRGTDFLNHQHLI